MRLFIEIVFLLFLPKSIFSSDIKNIANKDNEKFQQYPYERSNSLYCNDLNPQMHIDFNMLFGLWYGAEVITHHESESMETTYDSCVVVNIRQEGLNYGQSDYDYSNFDEKEHDRRQQYDSRGKNFNIHGGSQNRIQLTWDERGRTLEYTLRIEGNRRGLWITSGNQRGTMLDLPYNQFTGTIQVMKAVGNHLVLTFCETLPKSQFFTIVLTKKPHNLSRDDIQSIRGLLRRRGLNVQSVRKVCKNSSTSLRPLDRVSLLVLVIFAFLIQIIKTN